MSKHKDIICIDWTGSRHYKKNRAAQAWFDFKYLGRCVAGALPVTADCISLADLVPAAREFADKFTEIASAHAALCGRGISCRKGCTACCSYLLPLSAPEAIQLTSDIAALAPQKRDDLLGRFDNIRGRIFAAAQPKNLTAEALGEWYADLRVACPLLVNGLCSIYDKRPLACREWIVSSSPADCEGCQPDKGTRVPVLSMTEALGRIAAKLEGGDIDAVILPLAMDWTAENRARAEKTYPAKAVLDCLVRVISQFADESSSAAAA